MIVTSFIIIIAIVIVISFIIIIAVIITISIRRFVSHQLSNYSRVNIFLGLCSF